VKRVLIGGIGNVLLGDDGIGPYVVRTLEAGYEFDENVEIIDLGTPALDLIYKIVDLDLLILVDALANGGIPGAVACYEKADLVQHALPSRMDPHSPALSESLLAVDMLGNGPKEVMLIAVAGQRYETGCILSEAVRLSVEKVIREILNKLDEVGVPYVRRQSTPDIWWEPVTAVSV
jgi:hydrogenase maturation protease